MAYPFTMEAQSGIVCLPKELRNGVWQFAAIRGGFETRNGSAVEKCTGPVTDLATNVAARKKPFIFGTF
jgi:hypothetical protein